jgi:ferredoxin
MKRPVVELSECILCEVCTSVCPSVFTINDAGFVEVATLENYPENQVDEAIQNCPGDCILWEG